jgi:antitoxin VapB
MSKTPDRRAKVFWSGGSQAVRLPKEFRFLDDEVGIRREGNALILEPVPKREWPTGYWRKIDTLVAELPEIEPLGGRLLEVSIDDA